MTIRQYVVNLGLTEIKLTYINYKIVYYLFTIYSLINTNMSNYYTISLNEKILTLNKKPLISQRFLFVAGEVRRGGLNLRPQFLFRFLYHLTKVISSGSAF